MKHCDDLRPLAGGVVHDRSWAEEVRTSARCSAALFVLLLFVDWAAGSLDWWRGGLWLLLALLLLLVLFPARVSAGEGWLASRRLLRTRRVRTDLLVTVRPVNGVTRRLVLADAFGDRVEIDPELLIRNPDLWYRLDEGTRSSETNGTLRRGTAALHSLADDLDRETALSVFRASGLD